MICPVCENVQPPGPECEVCGVRLAAIAPPRVDVVPLPDLEPTALDGPAASQGRAADDDAAWIESTRTASVEVTVEAIEVERVTTDPTARVRTPAAATVCRYCRTPAVPGRRFCDTCGMSLPGVRTASNEPEPEPVRCRGCGTVVKGPSCPGCGARAPTV